MSKVNYVHETQQYVIGFVGAATLTILAYLSVKLDWFDATTTAIFVLVLAVLQFSVQVYYFLHLRGEAKPRWRSWTFIYSIVMMLVVVFGSLWVMYNLNYRMGMSGEAMEEYMLEQGKKGF
ncbi:cytochrome o ubiquinol oxidase subunit IV [Candidatus Saccharibacteria bacterium]|nr:cytochrome o ubiquinol oxidase subunit IV [Candidatus Saccharibacteria bacterium]